MHHPPLPVYLVPTAPSDMPPKKMRLFQGDNRFVRLSKVSARGAQQRGFVIRRERLEADGRVFYTRLARWKLCVTTDHGPRTTALSAAARVNWLRRRAPLHADIRSSVPAGAASPQSPLRTRPIVPYSDSTRTVRATGSCALRTSRFGAERTESRR